MATIWMSASGTDTASGTNYADAVKTLGAATALCAQGDTINVVNDGTHFGTDSVNVAVVDSGFVGTSWSDPGLVIQGTDSSGSAAIATVAATGGSSTYWLRFNNSPDYIQVQGLKFDYSAVTSGTADDLHPLYWFGAVNTVRVYDCEFYYGALGSSIPNTNIFFPLYYRTAANGTTTTVEVARCLVVNGQLDLVGNVYPSSNYHNNIIMVNATTYPAQGLLVRKNVALATGDDRFYNNTLVLKYEDTADDSGRMIYSTARATSNQHYHSNLLFCEVGTVASAGAFSVIQQGTVSATQTDVGTFSNDLVALGTNATASRTNWQSSEGYASYMFDAAWRAGGATDPNTFQTSSTLVTAATYADIFNETTTAWTWTSTAAGGSYSHDLPFDLRPIVGRTAALDGGVVGAVTAAIITPPPPGEDAGISYPLVLDSLPFYAPVLKADAAVKVRIQRNKNRQHVDFRHYLRDEPWNEFTTRYVAVEASSNVSLNLGGVAEATGFMLETDQDLTVTVGWNTSSGTDSFQATVSECMLFDQVPVSSLSVSNTSSTTANVHLSVFE